MLHIFKYKDLHLAFDVESASLHVMDALSAQICKWYQEKNLQDIQKLLQGKYEKKDVEQAYEEIENLHKKGQLFSDAALENKEEKFRNREKVVKALCLNITHDCNLACRYCFADEGKYKKNTALMSVETAKQSVDYLIKNSKNRKNLEIDFFGGEPLMNFNVVKETVYYAKSLEEKHQKHFRFTLTTNGTLLNEENEAFINEYMDNVVLSADGRKEIHDRLRPFKGGQSSYPTVIKNFQSLVAKRKKEYYVRGTFTNYNLDFTNDILHFNELGFKELSLEPVVGTKDVSYELDESMLPRIEKEYERLVDVIMDHEKKDDPFHFFHFHLPLSGGPCLYKRISSCGAGSEYLAVSPLGDLYPCHQYVGEETMKLGSLQEGITNHSLEAELHQISLFSKKDCKDCFAKYICGGGCSANSFHKFKNFYQTDSFSCKLQKKRIECALYLIAAKALLANEKNKYQPSV